MHFVLFFFLLSWSIGGTSGGKGPPEGGYPDLDSSIIWETLCNAVS